MLGSPLVSSRKLGDNHKPLQSSFRVLSPLASLTAAATPQPIPIPQQGSGSMSGTDDSWQSDAWNFFDNVGELQYVCTWLSNALSRSILVPSDVNEDGQPTGETQDTMIRETVASIAGGPAGQAALLGRLATFLTVPGDAHLAIIIRDAKEEWYVLSKDEVKKKSGDTVAITLPDGEEYELDNETDSITRIHRPHPRNAQLAHSPVRACIPILREIVRLGQHVEATAKSRLIGNGILVIPNELSVPRAPDVQAEDITVDPDAPGLPDPAPDDDPILSTPIDPVDLVAAEPGQNANDVMDNLIEVAGVAIQDPSSQAAMTPLVLQGPGEHIDKIQHITFGREFTEVVMKLREAATKRLAMTLDVPAEILLGTGDVNHWGAWQIEESAIKLHVEPLLMIICDVLTTKVLRPLLELHGHPDPESAVLWYSTAGLAMRPNRSAEAKEGYTLGVLSAAAYRKEIGFDDVDAPKIPTTDEERFEFVMQMYGRNPGSEVLASAVLKLIGVEVAPAAPAAPATGPSLVPNTDDAPDPEQKDKTTPIPDEPEEIAASAMRQLQEVH